ncbi:MAG: MASE1 domain-containing protein [Flavobacteriaceae bacterium]|nr:MASE1 domain-containing protein [Flavobacteriaceae bacterium]
MKQTPNKWFFIMAALASYLLFARFRYLLVFGEANNLAIWIPAGISLAIVLIKGYKYLPLVFIGNYLIEIITRSIDGFSILNSIPQHIFISLTDTFEVYIGVFLIYKISKSNLILKNSRNTISFILITVLISLLAASLGSFIYCLFNNNWSNYLVMFLSWWVNDSLGIFLITPLILSFPKKTAFKFKNLKILEFTFYLLIIFVFLFISENTQYPIKFVLIPILLISLFRFGSFISFTILLFIALYTAIISSHYEVGSSYYQNQDLIIYQLYFSVASILILVVSALIEEQKNNEAKILKSKIQFQSIFNSIQEAIIIYDNNYDKILDVNNYACEWLGYSRAEFNKMSAGDLASNTHNFTKNTAKDYFKKSKKAPQKFKWQIKDKKHNLYYCDIQLSKASVFDSENIIATIRDESDKHKLEQEITHAYIEAQEEEKQYFGEEIHDNIIQTLAAEQIFISAIDKLNEQKEGKLQTCISKLNELNINAINEIQKIAYGLMSNQIKEQGLILSIVNLCIDMSVDSKVKFNFSHKNIKEDEISDVLKINIFRIMQELTALYSKFSDGTMASIIIRKTIHNTIEIILRDPNKDHDFNLLQKYNEGRAINNINRRLNYFEGKININTDKEAGHKIKITFPLT